jgi:hypothetical protein
MEHGLNTDKNLNSGPGHVTSVADVLSFMMAWYCKMGSFGKFHLTADSADFADAEL